MTGIPSSTNGPDMATEGETTYQHNGEPTNLRQKLALWKQSESDTVPSSKIANIEISLLSKSRLWGTLDCKLSGEYQSSEYSPRT